MQRQYGAFRLAAATFLALLTLYLCAPARAAEVHLSNGDLLDASSPAPTGRLPVLFVHGHGDSDEANNPNYVKNWQSPLNSLPSFQQTLDLSPENDGLGIEPYYIRFLDQDRSITDDAREIGEAIELILHRHDPNYPAQPTHLQVAVVAYSKGTLSARQYLKSLRVQVGTLPAPRPGFQPVSEFVAIAPPNHGISTTLFATTTSLAVRQLYNGVRPEGVIFDCGDSFNTAGATDYVETLNGHPIEDTMVGPFASFADEAPGSRADGAPPTSGTLYVTLFADGNRDFVGGVDPSGDCVGRTVALNLSPQAINLPVASIPGTVNNELDRGVVHQNTVHTAEVMCLALFAVVHHRSPQGQSCQLVSGIPVIPPPTRAAAMLTLDMSGSMSAPACPGCATRAEVLKDAVELFVQLWSAVGAPSDRLGVTYFRTNVDQFTLAGDALPLLSAGGSDIIADVNGQTPGHSTAMGGGLQRSIEALDGVSADTPIRRVILFTDGMQNVNPIVRSIAGHHEIANETGRQNSNVTPTTPPRRLDQLAGIAVDTIGIGAGQAFVGLLQDIASETGGRTWLTTAPDDQLRRFFVEELINALRGFSPQLVAYRRGRTREGGIETFAIEGGARRLVLKLSWRRGRTMDFRVAKDGADITAAGRFIDGAFYKIFAIDLPVKGVARSAGRWQMKITGKPGIAYEAAAIADTDRLTYDATFATRRPKVGDDVELIVRIAADGGLSEKSLKVGAVLLGPDVAVGNIIVDRPATAPDKLRGAEPGATAAERRLLGVAQSPRQWALLAASPDPLSFAARGKGVFRAAFRPRVPGIYLAVIQIAGVDPKLGAFTRTLTVTTAVAFGKADPKASALALSDSGAGGGRRYVTLIVTPRDARGNRLGPGLSSSVQLELSTGRPLGGTHDLGDGRYLFLAALSPGDDPAVTLMVADSVLFAGRLSALARQTRR
jgi:hypothetical protein